MHGGLTPLWLTNFQCGIVKTKPETKDIKSRNVLEEGDHGVFRSP